MKKIILLTFFVSGLLLIVRSQPITFEFCYGGNHADAAYCIQELQEGGYVIAGHTRGDDYHYSISLVKIDEIGNVIWNETYGLSNVAWTALTSGRYVQVTLDQNFIVAGSDDDGEMWILKINSANGNVIWDKTFVNYTARCIEPLSDGSYIVCGCKKITEEDSDLMVMKLNNNGILTWSKLYGGDEYDIGKSIKQTFDNGYIVAGRTKSYGNGDSDIWLIKLDESGDMQWSVIKGGAGQDYASSVIQFTDSCYVIAGSTSNAYMNVMKFDTNGVLLWNKNLGYNSYASCVQQTNDGGLIVSGHKLVANSDYDYRIYKLKDEGSVIWNRDFGYNGSDHAWHVIQASDGGYAVAGESWSCDPNSSSMWILKLDEYGNLLTDIHNVEDNNVIRCFPNPVKQYLNVVVGVNCEDELQFKLFNLNGQKVFDEDARIMGLNNTFTIDLTGFSDGIYFLNVTGNDISITKKIILSGVRN